METNELVPSLALFTLISVLVIAVIGFMLFKRKAANRHPMDKASDDTIATVAVDDGETSPRTVESTDQLNATTGRSPDRSDSDYRL